MALPRGDVGLSSVCDCGISWSYSLTIFVSITDFVKLLLFCNSLIKSTELL